MLHSEFQVLVLIMAVSFSTASLSFYVRKKLFSCVMLFGMVLLSEVQ